MRPSLSVRTLYRSPVRTLLTFILLAVVTFAFFSQVAEYAVTTREFNNAVKQYYGLGAVEIKPPDVPVVENGYYLQFDPRIEKYPYNTERWFNKSYTPVRYPPLTQEQVGAISSFPYISFTDMRYMTAGVSDTYYRLDERNIYNHTLRCIVEGTLEIVPEQPGALCHHGAQRLGEIDAPVHAGRP